MRIAQQKVRRCKNQVIRLQSILNTLKNNQLLDETQTDMLHMLGQSTGQIFKRLIRHEKNERVCKQYTLEIIIIIKIIWLFTI